VWHANGGAEASPVAVVLLDQLAIEPDRAEVLRYMGYPTGVTPSAQVEERVEQAIEASRGKTRPRATYSIYPVTAHDRYSLTLAGGARFTGPVGDFLGHAQRAAVFLATAGPEVVGMAEDAARHGDILGNLVYHGLGAALAEATVEHIVADLLRHLGPGEALTLRYSPGYCGISLTQQRTLFGLVDAASVGVELLPTLIMKPIKSVSGVIGIGPADAVAAYGNPCDRCPLVDCVMRR